MHSPQDNNSTSPKRRRNYRRRPVTGHSRAVQTMAPQASSSRSNGNAFVENFPQSGTSRGELMAELESMLEILRQCGDGERGQLRPRVPSVNKDAASDAEDGIHAKIGCMESDMRKIKEDLASLNDVREAGPKIIRMESDLDRMKELVSLSNVREIAQKIGRMESDLDGMKRELAGLSSMRVSLAGLQEQLQMLLSAYMIHSQLPSQMYPSAQPPPYN
ncbi:hypothetical protein MY4038_009442 [Beauveria bassiana]